MCLRRTLTDGHHADEHHEAETHHIAVEGGALLLEVHEDGVPPRFRLRAEGAKVLPERDSIETIRPDGTRQIFTLADRGDFLESADEIPEPHAFTALVHAGGASYSVVFEEHQHGAEGARRDNNMRAAVVHVVADAAVSVLVIVGLVLARTFGWLWMDPVAGIVGALVIASWSYGLIRDTGAILLDMTPDPQLAGNLRRAIEQDGDRLGDLHLWRVGPGHLAAILSVVTTEPKHPDHYRARLSRYKVLSHITVEVLPKDPA